MPVTLRESLPESLLEGARLHAERTIGLFDGRGRRLEERGIGAIVDSALDSATRLAGLGVEEGDRVVVCLPTGWDWFNAWLGSLLRGALPLATAAGTAIGSNEALVRRLNAIVTRVGARLLICAPRLKESLPADSPAAAIARTSEEVADSTAIRGFKVPRSDPDDIAFLQLTSGSTGEPKAVMIRHRAVFHQIESQDFVVGAPYGKPSFELLSKVVYWLPLYHDMGLLAVLYSILYGVDMLLLPPRAFLARPRLWLEGLGSGGFTVASAPNFGYQLCVERLKDEEIAQLDLSGFRFALTGAETVRADTMDAFVERFGPRGFQASAFRPCYGLAEGTLAVTPDRKGEVYRTRSAPSSAATGIGLKELVGLGEPIPETEVRIVGPDGSALPAGEVGEILVRGPAVFAGYYNDPEATARTLRKGWLHTEDLGLLDAGELFITGRLKDLLIVRGENVMPHEIEWLAESASGGGGSCRAAALSVPGGAEGERLVLVLEVAQRDSEGLSATADEVRSRVGRELALPIADVVFIRRGKIPKTTSGKVQRAELRADYLEGRLERLA